MKCLIKIYLSLKGLIVLVGERDLFSHNESH